MRTTIVMTVMLVAAVAQNARAQEELANALCFNGRPPAVTLVTRAKLNPALGPPRSDFDAAGYEIQYYARIMPHPSPAAGAFEREGRKSPHLAFALSFLVPGLGQHYNGQFLKGAVQEAIWLIGFGMMFSRIFSEDASWGGSDDEDRLIYIGFSISMGASVWSMIDAPISASKINSGLEQSRRGPGGLDRGRDIAGIDLELLPHGARAGISWRF